MKLLRRDLPLTALVLLCAQACGGQDDGNAEREPPPDEPDPSETMRPVPRPGPPADAGTAPEDAGKPPADASAASDSGRDGGASDARGDATPPDTQAPPPAQGKYNATVKPIFGWDASDYDYDRGMRASHIMAAQREGIRFFTHKATEQSGGGAWRHQHFKYAVEAARAAGIPFLGAYIVVRSGIAVTTQVKTALDYVNAQTPWWKDFPGWFWQVDLEKWPYDAVPAALGEEMAAELERQTGRKALLYASRGQYGDSLPGTRPLWNANYNGAGAARPFKLMYAGDAAPGWVRYSGRMPVVLQYTSSSIIGGQSRCDANAFRGTEADFAKLINAR